MKHTSFGSIPLEKSRVTSVEAARVRRRRSLTGFTLLELLVATSILLVIMGTAVPLVTEYYSTYRLLTAEQDLLSILRKSQELAMSNQHKKNSGVYISSSSYIIFQGSSYASRTTDFDDSTLYSGGITMSGPSEIVFAQLSGRPSASGTITIADNKSLRTIILNGEGGVDW